MKRFGGSVFFYGAASADVLGKIVRSMPFDPITLEFAFEHFGHGLKIDWKDGKTAARRRNYRAAMECSSLVVIGHPRYITSVVTAFRQRGRRIFWWNGKALREVDVPDTVIENLSRLPKEAIFEPTLWTDQRVEREAKIRDYLDEHPEKQRTLDEIPTFGWVEVFNEDEIECSDTDIFKRCRRSKLAEL